MFSRGINRDASDEIAERRGGCQAAIARRAGSAVAGDRRDHPQSVDLADAVIEVVGQVEIATGIESDSCWTIQGRFGRRTAVACETAGTGARNRRDDSCRCFNLADLVVPQLADVNVAGRVPAGPVGRTIVAFTARPPSPVLVLVPVPAKAWMIPLVSTLRTRLLVVSAM